MSAPWIVLVKALEKIKAMDVAYGFSSGISLQECAKLAEEALVSFENISKSDMSEDKLYKLLMNGEADCEAQQNAALWIARLNQKEP